VPRNPIVGSFAVGCCARAASGHAAVPPSSKINSRRFLSNIGSLGEAAIFCLTIAHIAVA
jgi:hypothetical protein